jgi:hypothetical protein
MKNYSVAESITSWIFGILLFTIGVLNIALVHPVPGLVFVLASVLFLRPVNVFLTKNLGFAIPLAVKIGLALILIWFTLGVSDVGDIIDAWLA